MFIISSTGIYLTIHYCSSEDITGLFLFTPLTEEPCEHHQQEHNKTNCCANTSGNHNGSETDKCSDHILDDIAECCSNTVLYIAVEDDFVKTDHPALQLNCNLLFSAFGFDITGKAGNSDHFSLAEYIDRPPLMHGRELTLFTRILLL